MTDASSLVSHRHARHSPGARRKKAEWLSPARSRHRSYAGRRASRRSNALRARFDVVEYGAPRVRPRQLSRCWPSATATGTTRLPVRARHRRRARLRDQRRARRAARSCDRACGRTSPAASTCWSRPASARGPTSASIAGTPDAIDPNRSFRAGQPVAGIGGADAAGRAGARSRAGAYRPARNHRHRRVRIPSRAGRARRQAVRARRRARRLLPGRRQRVPAAWVPGRRSSRRSRRSRTSLRRTHTAGSSVRPSSRPA